MSRLPKVTCSFTDLFPDKITAQVQYGEIIRSWCVYYQYQHFIPEDRLQQLFKDMYGVSLATASISIRLSNYREDVLRFLHAPEVPFTNNEAERDLRMMKCKQKISGGFRSAHGANQFARIRGFINTMRKQGLNRLKAIQSIFSGDIMLAAGC